MLVSRLEAGAAYRRVMVPVDFSVHSIVALRFSQQIAPGADTLVFHAYDHPYASDLHPADVPDQAIDLIVLGNAGFRLCGYGHHVRAATSHRTLP